MIIFSCVGEKRPLEDAYSTIDEPPKRKKLEGDIPMDTITEFITTITDPKEMLGPEVDWHIYNPFSSYIQY